MKNNIYEMILFYIWDYIISDRDSIIYYDLKNIIILQVQNVLNQYITYLYYLKFL